jgi:hypothetical protein
MGTLAHTVGKVVLIGDGAIDDDLVGVRDEGVPRPPDA